MIDAQGQLRKLKNLRLLPESHARLRGSCRLRQWLWAGAAVALLMICLDGIGYSIRLEGAMNQLRTAQGMSEQYEQLEQSSMELHDTIVAMGNLKRNVDRETCIHIDFTAAMNELSQITSATIRFGKVAFRHGENRVNCSLTGYAFSSGSEGDGLEQFMDQLRGSPLFEEVQLVSVQSAQYSGRTAQRFDVSFVLLAMPRPDRLEKDLALVAEREE